MRHLFEEYNNTVSTASVEDFCRTVIGWLEQHCSLPALRPGKYCIVTVSLSTTSEAYEQALIISGSAGAFFARGKIMRPLAMQDGERFAMGSGTEKVPDSWQTSPPLVSRPPQAKKRASCDANNEGLPAKKSTV